MPIVAQVAALDPDTAAKMVKDRGLRHERQLEARLPGMLAKVELPLRVRWFAADREARRTP